MSNGREGPGPSIQNTTNHPILAEKRTKVAVHKKALPFVFFCQRLIIF